MAEAQMDAIMFSFGIAVPSLIPTPPLAEISQFDEHLCIASIALAPELNLA